MVHRVTQALVHLIGANNWEHRFQTAIKTAKESGAKDLEPIETLQDLYEYIDAFLKWVPSEDHTGGKIFQELIAYQYIFNQPSVMGLQSTILPGCDTREDLTELSQWMVMFSSSVGMWLDEKPNKSLTRETFETFLKTPDTFPDGKPGYRIQNYRLPAGAGPNANWWDYSFNDFFTREFKDIEKQRPVEHKDDDFVIVSGADSSFDGHWKIDPDATVAFNYMNDQQVEIKSLPYNISQLLDGSEYSKAFAGGIFMHSMLGPADYHRLHSPVNGVILEAKVVPGNTYAEVYVKAEPGKQPRLAHRRPLRPLKRLMPAAPGSSEGGNTQGSTGVDSPNYPGYQFSQARGLVIIKSEKIGLVAFLPIGMGHVSSVMMAEGIKPGARVKKGQELSRFMFGGSDYVMCFQKGVELDFEEFGVQKDKWVAVRSAFLRARLNQDFKKSAIMMA